MNKRGFRRKRVEHDEKFLALRQRECNNLERKIEYDMATRQKDTIQALVEATVKIVKLEIKELLKELLEGKSKE